MSDDNIPFQVELIELLQSIDNRLANLEADMEIVGELARRMKSGQDQHSEMLQRGFPSFLRE